ncbi:MAG: hypothetical protein U5P41_02380 [Gammaproteobacteria bacterium]|nr:hypothetical protein [Gammaproteobacteria bacterium]
MSFKPLPGLTASLAYTYSRFKFDRFIDGNGNVFSDNDIPGIPRHLGNFELEYFHPSGFYTTWNTQLVGSFYADDANID